jgi:glycosyltransferase involved in cell wall biosynthesis
MRVLIVGINYAPEPTGIAPYTSGLAVALQRRGDDVAVITGYPHYPAWRVADGYRGFSRTDVINGVTVKRLRHFVPASPRLLNRLLMELTFGLRASLARWHRPDAVIVVSPALFSSRIALMRARLTRARRIVWVQDLYGLGVAETGQAKGRVAGTLAAFERETFRRGDRVVVIHDRFKKHLVEDLGLDPANVDVVRNWSHVAEIPRTGRADVRRELGWADDDVVVVHAGNMGAKQGLENVVRAARLASERGSRVRFVLVGDGNRRPALEGLLESLGGCDRLAFIPPLPDEEFRPVLAAADILLVNERPGLDDMCVPSKLTTYFSTGLPVLAATDATSVTAEEIAFSGGGMRVDAGDPEALLNGAERLGDDPGLRAFLGAAGREFKSDFLSEDAAVDGFLAALAG